LLGQGQDKSVLGSLFTSFSYIMRVRIFLRIGWQS
jgi:hypothetical protein